ncbi:helix-turn-helix transcriptional regulator [Marinobacter fonticola]|uniref:helix-turn-helix transcriptional regulator n=1 Tax=Marinobacter fonticola TaxID=2603215 RepID=UPI0011E699F9|nr:helix-turn-helix transcriptional regulator [Marinobacter fonticola]
MVLPRPTEWHTPFQALRDLINQSNWMRTVFYHVENTPASRLNASDLAAALSMSVRSLNRRVQRDSPYSCGQLMRRIKLNHVSDELISTTKPVSVVSHELGFSDDTSMRRSFRQVAGMTPKAYREAFG